ncbi:Smr/MutS family protein [Paracoccus sp. JM45]|uniref:Smr/MutS family protein n=1 Tax=Paracoccus sp. JM45 TaxID=2283626 RepID=UPI000E6C9D1B|nr:Smr/MutS family protein [Paracoccus sp. JM45]RJE80996.1 DNA mismatch repair protein MutS [Paracoccus sp. JM45]
MRRRKGLTAEDKEIWALVARTATPMHKTSLRLPGAAEEHSAQPRTSVTPPVPQPLPRFRVGQTASQQAPRLAKPVSPAERLSAADLRMDAKTHRKMSQGKMRPEARLDLHGMTLSAAQPELMHFIMSCHSSGLRLVLVITGKGRGDYGPLPTRPGALRHQVPYWLHSPPLSMVVQQVTAAHYKHGGEGAYYVYLRRHP